MKKNQDLKKDNNKLSPLIFFDDINTIIESYLDILKANINVLFFIIKK